MTEPLVAAVPRWWFIASNTAAPANARSAISMVIGASCKWMAMPPIISWRAPIAAMMASHSLAAGHTADASSTCCMLQGARKWQRQLSSGWQGSGRSRTPCAVKARRACCRASASLRGGRRRSLRSLAADLAADLRQVQTGRGNPLCRLAPCNLRTLPDRRSHRARLQHRRTCHQAPQTITRKNSLFAAATAADEPGNRRNAAADSENEQCRSIRLAQPNTSAYRQRLAEQRNRRAYPMEPRRLTSSTCRLLL